MIGIDFSGAATDKNTWAAKGRLSGNGLMLTECRPISRSDLALLLESRDPGTVAALDFPFSVPEGFAGYWVPRAGSMPSLWAAAGSDWKRDSVSGDLPVISVSSSFPHRSQ